MSSKRFWIILLVPFFLFTCNQKGKKKEDQYIVDYNRQVVIKIQKLTNDNDQAILQDQNVYWGNDSINVQMLSDYVAQTIFFYFSYNTCPPCIEQSIERLSQFIPDYQENDKVVFISPDYLPRLRDDCYGKRLLGLKNKRLGIPLEEENVPFFFTISKDMKINNLHIVNKTNFNYTTEYLKDLVFKL